MYLLVVDRKNRRLLQLLYSWYKGGPSRRRVSPGVIIDRLSTNSLLMSEGKEAITLLHHLKGKERDKIKVFKVEELSWPDMKKEIVEVFKRGSEESSRA